MSDIQAVPIPTARRIAKDAGAHKLVIIALYPGGEYSFTTYGETRAICQRLGKWADKRAEQIAVLIERETEG